ncbi:hypothetical protein D3C87_222380 [compost metagenome]
MGGFFAPANLYELNTWLQTEFEFWQWLGKTSTQGSMRRLVDALVDTLRQAEPHIKAAYSHSQNWAAVEGNVKNIYCFLSEVYLEKKLPHSTSVIGKRLTVISQVDADEALAYLFVFLPNAGYSFDAKDSASWKGFLEGMFEKYGFAALPTEAFDTVQSRTLELHAEAAKLIRENTNIFRMLEDGYRKLSREMADSYENQKIASTELLDQIKANHDEATLKHSKTMSRLEDAFREKMGLRAPVEYWSDRQKYHQTRSKLTGAMSFGLISFLGVLLVGLSFWVLGNLTAEGKPEFWRVSVLVLLGVLGIWAIRLVVRIFLSHVHLTSDASERITMVKTYLSLIESGSTLSDADRTLILQSLFRPATDGIVKDEGLPHPLLEALTRSSGK